MPFPRAAGILLHPTSLPGPYGIGDLGPEAMRFVDFLADAQQAIWQVNPLGPTGYGDSPYSGHSAFAGNPLLVSPDRLLEQGLLRREDLGEVPGFPADKVDFGWVIPWKRALLRTAFRRHQAGDAPVTSARLAALADSAEMVSWLDDFALFMALKEYHGGAVWNTWEPGAARHDEAALSRFRRELADDIDFHVFCQCLFWDQWAEVKQYAGQRGIAVFGDIPIFVAYDSADVWANRDLFELTEDGTPLAVAGVPPDYFSETGQLWGNPLYDWPKLQARGFDWWVARFRTTLRMVDAVRLDHFRGFESYWRVPAGEETAINGKWVKCPGRELFETVREALGTLPIMAEDLGVITPAVEKLRDDFAFPGMKILQFAWCEGTNGCFQPHQHEANCVVYTGTHDNDTAVGWWLSSGDAERERVRHYLGYEPYEINWALNRVALGSVANTTLIPMQDVLGLDGWARMNCPGQPAGNWQWRIPPDARLADAADRLRDLTVLYQRDAATQAALAAEKAKGTEE